MLFVGVAFNVNVVFHLLLFHRIQHRMKSFLEFAFIGESLVWHC